MKEAPRKNRLASESSPYLLQHAHNPVDWYPWGEEAFAEARRLDRPILLSIGYSACHWCHVMAHESFEDEDIAEIMNAHFINIKVDREERPDLDQIYQNAVQLFIRRGGGWPLTLFLSPEKIPFYGGTYFPPEDRYQLPGFPKILQAMNEAWQERRGDVSDTLQNVQAALRQARLQRGASAQKELHPDLLEEAVESLSRIFDEHAGGFGGAPKFPGTPSLALFLRFYHQSGDKEALRKVTYSLGRMAWGGIYDQLGGGFHRYSVDAQWQVPHFEKMLYDNAQLARLYFWTFQASQAPFYKKIGVEILDYVLREMRAPEGGFYAAQDADSEGGEGRYFTWRPEEVQALLGEEQSAIFCRYYNITSAGNFEGRSIPHLSRPLEALAKEFDQPLSSIKAMIEASKARLLEAREGRPKPFRDEKILTHWNSLMISAFVTGHQVTGDKRFLLAAEKAAGFILEHLYRENRLLHCYKDGTAKLAAYLDDVAYFTDALLDLFESTGKPLYLRKAKSLANDLISSFWDHEAGACFFTSETHEALIDRNKPVHDQSLPSGNAVAAQALQRLGYLSAEKKYQEKAEVILKAFASEMEENCFATGNMIAAADWLLRGPQEIQITGSPEIPETKALLEKIHQLYLPNKLISFKGQETEAGPSVVICKRFSCSAPLKRWEEIRKNLLAP